MRIQEGLLHMPVLGELVALVAIGVLAIEAGLRWQEIRLVEGYERVDLFLRDEVPNDDVAVFLIVLFVAHQCLGLRRSIRRLLPLEESCQMLQKQRPKQWRH